MASEFKVVLSQLKKILKARKMKYRDLADKVGLSESAIKKIFSGDDCSFRRLNSMCQVLDTKLYDILAEIETEQMKPARFTDQQEQFFCENIDYFNFFWKLVVERISLDDIKEQSQLSEECVFKYLKKLDELELIELHAEGKVKIPKYSLQKWVGSGPLTRLIQEKWSVNLVKDLVEHREEEGHVYAFRFLRLKESSLTELHEAIDQLEYEFVKRSIREASAGDADLKFTRFFAGAAPGSFAPTVDS